MRKLTEAFDATMAAWDLFLFDGFGSYDPDVIYNRIEYLASGLDCKIIFLDHLSILLSGLDGDERRMIDTTMTRLRSLVERTGIALFLVSHLRRTTGDKNHEEGARVTLGQFARICCNRSAQRLSHWIGERSTIRQNWRLYDC
jgi:twinkle protein